VIHNKDGTIAERAATGENRQKGDTSFDRYAVQGAARLESPRSEL